MFPTDGLQDNRFRLNIEPTSFRDLGRPGCLHCALGECLRLTFVLQRTVQTRVFALDLNNLRRLKSYKRVQPIALQGNSILASGLPPQPHKNGYDRVLSYLEVISSAVHNIK